MDAINKMPIGDEDSDGSFFDDDDKWKKPCILYTSNWLYVMINAIIISRMTESNCTVNKPLPSSNNFINNKEIMFC